MWTEDEYKALWHQDPWSANMLLLFTERMDTDGVVRFSSEDELKGEIEMRFASPGEYRYKVPVC